MADKIVEGTDGDDAVVQGSEYNEIINGGLGSDNLYSAAGADTFVWTLDDITAGAPSIDVIKDGEIADKIDISDLLIGEEIIDADETKAEVLSDYLNIYANAEGNTVLDINVAGEFNTADAIVNQTIVIEGFDLTAGNTLSDVDIINNLIPNLIVD